MIALALALIISSAAPSEGPPPILHPKTYVSHSSEYELWVNPSTRSGAGEGDYELKRNGELVWAGRLPFTLWEAAVADDGTVAGYGYTNGWRAAGDSGRVVLALVAPDGRVLVDKRIDRKGVYLHGPPVPMGAGVFVDVKSDRAVVRVSHGFRTVQEFWTWKLSTGEFVRTFKPDGKHANTGLWSSASAVPLRGTPLTLIHHWYANQANMKNWLDGASYTLVDEMGREVWSLLREREFVKLDLDASGHGAPEPILEPSADGRFALWFTADDQRVEFEVIEDETLGWQVAELSREPYTVPAKPKPATISALALKLIASVPLGGARQDLASIHDVLAFGFGEANIVRVLCEDKEVRNELTVVVSRTDDSTILSERRVAIPVASAAGASWLPLAGHRWLVTIREKAWFVDERTGELASISEFPGHRATGLAATSDGGFVMLDTHDHRFTSSETLYRFGPDGTVQWSVGEGETPHEPAKLFNPEDVAVTTNGEVVVLDNLRNELAYFATADGNYLRTIDLVSALGVEPNYACGVSRDVKGGVLFEDFDGDPPLWRLDARGNVRSSYRPRFDSGAAQEELYRNAQVAPDGAVWTTDGNAILRLNDNGIVDFVVGELPRTNILHECGMVGIDSKGRVLIQDNETFGVHVFDATGTRTALLVPQADDFDERSFGGQVTVRHDGHVAVSTGDWDKTGYVLFDAKGERVGLLPLGGDLAYLYGQSGSWLAGYCDVDRLDGEGKLIKTLSRRADNHWIRTVGDLDVSVDGTLAVLDEGNSMVVREAAVATYDENGKPLEVFELPSRVKAWSVAVNSDWIVVAGFDASICLVDRNDGSLHSVSFASVIDQGNNCYYDFGQDDTELWVVESGTRTVLHRFELPAQ